MVFKKESVTRRLKRLEEVLAKLRERAGITFEEFRGDTDAQWIIERGLEIASSLDLPALSLNPVPLTPTSSVPLTPTSGPYGDGRAAERIPGLMSIMTEAVL